MRRFRWGTLVTMTLSVNAIALAVWIDPPPRLIWNASPSVPIGFYTVEPGAAVHTGDLAVVRPPDEVARFMAARGYLPADVPLIKPVTALAGQEVCRTDMTITIDGRPVGDAQAADRFGRPLPVWRGCRTLDADHLFLMNPARSDSLDGRYFGPTPIWAVVGRATPLRTRAEPPASPTTTEGE